MGSKRKQREIKILSESHELVRFGLGDAEMNNIYVVFAGSPDSPYSGGEYILHIKLNDQWPFEAPVVRLITPSGRFSPSTPICISGMTHYHGDTYSPKMTLELLVIGFISMMHENIEGVAHISTSDDEKRRFAKQSIKWNNEWEKNNPDVIWRNP